jgi:two-component system, chemotaxis family, response regulator Rcp1
MSDDSIIGRPVEILLVEDNPGDARWTRELLKEISIPTNLTVVKDGVEGLAYLQHEEPHREATRPDLIFLDLHLPRKDGLEFLADMKQRALPHVPIVILAAPGDDQDVTRSLAFGAISYIAKPVDVDRLALVIRIIAEELAAGETGDHKESRLTRRNLL